MQMLPGMRHMSMSMCIVHVESENVRHDNPESASPTFNTECRVRSARSQRQRRRTASGTRSRRLAKAPECGRVHQHCPPAQACDAGWCRMDATVAANLARPTLRRGTFTPRPAQPRPASAEPPPRVPPLAGGGLPRAQAWRRWARGFGDRGGCHCAAGVRSLRDQGERHRMCGRAARQAVRWARRPRRLYQRGALRGATDPPVLCVRARCAVEDVGRG